MNITSFHTSLGWITLFEDNDMISAIKFGKKKNIGWSPILNKLKKAGLLGAHRGVINDKKNKFSHIGFLLFKNRKSYKKSMQIG